MGSSFCHSAAGGCLWHLNSVFLSLIPTLRYVHPGFSESGLDLIGALNAVQIGYYSLGDAAGHIITLARFCQFGRLGTVGEKAAFQEGGWA